MDDTDVLKRIGKLVDEEHALRARHDEGSAAEADREQLARLEVTLDQCWDLLRQRRARREFGENPRDAEARPATTVEGYQQ